LVLKFTRCNCFLPQGVWDILFAAVTFLKDTLDGALFFRDLPLLIGVFNGLLFIIPLFLFVAAWSIFLFFGLGRFSTVSSWVDGAIGPLLLGLGAHLLALL
jgi:hypothetical protein